MIAVLESGSRAVPTPSHLSNHCGDPGVHDPHDGTEQRSMTRLTRPGARAFAAVAATFIFLAAIGRISGDTFFVDAQSSSSMEDGSPTNPLHTIQGGINGARDRNSL